MKKLWKLLALLLVLSLALSLPVFADGGGTESAGNGGEPADGAPEETEAAGETGSAPLVCGAGETLTAEEGAVICAEGGVVFNNGATVYNNGGTVYNNFGLVYNNAGVTFNNRGTVFVNGGVVFNNDGAVVFNDGELIDNAAAPGGEAPVEEEPFVEEEPLAEEALPVEEVPPEEEAAPEEEAVPEEAPPAEEEPPAEAAAAEPAAPSADREAGVCPPGTELTLTAGEGAVIRYTLDGSEPDERSEEYAGPIRLDGSVVLTARAWYADGVQSSLFSADYTVPAVSAPVFEPLTQGYRTEEIVGASAAVTNDGTRSLTIQAARLNGRDSGQFLLAWEKNVTIAPGETNDAAWVVKPRHKLPPGEYEAYLVLILESGETVPVPFSLTVEKA